MNKLRQFFGFNIGNGLNVFFLREKGPQAGSEADTATIPLSQSVKLHVNFLRDLQSDETTLLDLSGAASSP